MDDIEIKKRRGHRLETEVWMTLGDKETQGA